MHILVALEKWAHLRFPMHLNRSRSSCRRAASWGCPSFAYRECLGAPRRRLIMIRHYDEVPATLARFVSLRRWFVLRLNLALTRQELRFLWTIVNDQMHSELLTESESPSGKKLGVRVNRRIFTSRNHKPCQWSSALGAWRWKVFVFALGISENKSPFSFSKKFASQIRYFVYSLLRTCANCS